MDGKSEEGGQDCCKPHKCFLKTCKRTQSHEPTRHSLRHLPLTPKTYGSHERSGKEEGQTEPNLKSTAGKEEPQKKKINNNADNKKKQ